MRKIEGVQVKKFPKMRKIEMVQVEKFLKKNGINTIFCKWIMRPIDFESVENLNVPTDKVT